MTFFAKNVVIGVTTSRVTVNLEKFQKTSNNCTIFLLITETSIEKFLSLERIKRVFCL